MKTSVKYKTIECPQCGHHLHTEIDASEGDQDYYEECPNCCHEFHLNLHIDNYYKKLQLTVDSDDEQIY